MPHHPETGKLIRRRFTEAELLDFRLEQLESPSEVKRGKQKARNSPDDGGQGELVPSPLASISALGDLTLDSGGSSAANTPADSPSTLPRPPFSENPVQAQEKASKTHGAPKHSPGKPASRPTSAALAQHSTGVAFEEPTASPQLLKPALRQLSRSHSTSPASDDGSNAVRISALENRQNEIEKWAHNFDLRLKKLGG
jgi:hypothetical protein